MLLSVRTHHRTTNSKQVWDSALLYPRLFINSLEGNMKWPLIKGTDDQALVAGWLMRQPRQGMVTAQGLLETCSCSQCSEEPGGRKSVDCPLSAGPATCSRAPEGLEVIMGEQFSANTSPGVLTNRGKGCLGMSTQGR